jgi:hypothetical protein
LISSKISSIDSNNSPFLVKLPPYKMTAKPHMTAESAYEKQKSITTVCKGCCTR